MCFLFLSTEKLLVSRLKWIRSCRYAEVKTKTTQPSVHLAPKGQELF